MTESGPLIALRAGVALDEHENPGDATVAVLIGRVALRWGANSAEGVAGDLLVVPDARHSLEALEDSVVVLSAVPSR
jgi:quercetin dioxygenase-like cupin family protein